MKRREFLGVLGGAAVLPFAAHAQQGEPVRRVGVLMYGVETDSELVARFSALRKGLQDLGWTAGTNVQFDYRYGADDESIRGKAKELVALGPDVIMASAPPSVIA